MESLVLVTGGAGYVGSLLIPRLLQHGYRVRVMDTLMYHNGPVMLPYMSHPKFEFYHADICQIDDVTRCCKDVDAVVHLAALVGDPLCNRLPERAMQVNFEGTKNIVDMARDQRISRFIFASTCSNYGVNESGNLATEETVLRPVSLYADTKVRSENYIITVTNAEFQPVILRFATMFGLAPRMRFDLVINILTLHAVQRRKVVIFGGQQWRPLISVSDVSENILKVLQHESFSPNDSLIFNVGDSAQNVQIRDLAPLIVKVFPDVNVKELSEEIDTRSYRVDFSKFKHLTGFSAQHALVDGIREIKRALESGIFHEPGCMLHVNEKVE